MCLQCPEHCPNQENKNSKEELWSLFCTAHKQYQSEIVEGGKLYDRYVNDVVSYHLPTFQKEEEAVRNHFKNVFSLYELLTERKDLVVKYFSPKIFEEKDYRAMLYAFNHISPVVEYPQSLAIFNSNQIRLITQFANESNFFVNDICEETMDHFFKCTLQESLEVINMRYVLAFLYALSQEKMIPHNWVSLIADNQMLTPQKTMHPSTRIAISVRLTELKASSAVFPGEQMTNFVKQLKEMQ